MRGFKIAKMRHLLLFLALVGFVVGQGSRFRQEFPGPYCAARADRCCRDRQDGCAQPISTTLCYCDEFCERGEHGDCCPDYEEVCMGIAPEPENATSCVYKNRYFTPYDQALMDNCNTCKCNMDGSVTCTEDVCLADDDLLRQLHHLERSIGWKATNYSEWWGRKYDEGKVLRLGTFQPRFRVKAMKRLSNKGGHLPSRFDASEHWTGLVAEARDQGWCGSSWAFSTATMASDRFAILSKGREMVQLAPQQMLACVRRQQGCSGGHLDTAWQYLRRTGVVNEECYPYIAAQNVCKISNDDTLITANCELPVKVNRTLMYKMGPAFSLNNETDIMAEIKDRGTVQAIMRVYRDFFSYRSGIYRHSAAATPAEERSAYHSVRLIGWGEERVGYDVVKYWIAINSWGQWWGENGRFRILRGSNECDIESYVLASNPYVHEHVQAIRKVGELQELIVGTGYVPHPSRRYPPYAHRG
ncbi:tubulointerstitial nephritis antigen-like isoform X1 [Anopheles merus]|uniref:SMB domain-containing protein n=2 Tax=Anopheles merus TaxID=30066 RepID=A0A453Z1G6_ANOME|nr:tubulointerstitial nephritis antigen-like isoform X1 [Anopheles merus]